MEPWRGHRPRPGAEFFEARGINNRTQVVGCASDGAVLWQRGTFVVLPVPAGGVTTRMASGINDRGQVVGSADVAVPVGSALHAVLWTR